MKKLLKGLGGGKMKRKDKAIKCAVWFFYLTVISFAFFGTSIAKADVLFEDNFDGTQASTWSSIPTGGPDFLNYITLNGNAVLRMASIMSNYERKGIYNTNKFNFSRGQIIVDFRTMPYEDDNINADNKKNIDGILDFYLFSPTGPTINFHIFGGDYGFTRTAVINGNGYSERSAPGIWNYEQNYRIVVTSVGNTTEVSFRNAEDNVLFEHTFEVNLGVLGDFYIVLEQFMGTPGEQYYSDVALDYLRVFDLSHLNCIGFGPPMDNGPVKVKKNKVLPLNAQLFDTEGLLVTDADIVAPPVIQVFYNSEPGGDPVDVTESALPAGEGTEGNQFVFTEEGTWTFHLKTKNYSAPGTYTIYMDSGDDSEYVIDQQCQASFVIN